MARSRLTIAERWEQSFGDPQSRAHVRQVASPTYAPRSLAVGDTVQWLVASAGSSGVFAGGYELLKIDGFTQLGLVGVVVSGAAILAMAPKLLKASWLLLRNGSLEGSLKQVARVVLSSLHFCGIVPDHDMKNATFEILKDQSGRRDIVLTGTTRATERAVMEALVEVLGPVGNPRFLLVRHSWFGPKFRTDYHAIPTAIAKRKEWAEYFCKQWRSQIGASKLLFTRTAEGRLVLLRARAKSFAAGFQRIVERRSAWL